MCVNYWRQSELREDAACLYAARLPCCCETWRRQRREIQRTGDETAPVVGRSVEHLWQYPGKYPCAAGLNVVIVLW